MIANKMVTEDGSYTLNFTAESDITGLQLYNWKSGEVGEWREFYDIHLEAIEQAYQTVVPTVAGDEATDTSKFQVISDITRQDVIVQQVVNNKAVYKTIKGLNTITTPSITEIANAQSASILANGLYGNNTTYSLLNNTLNTGIYDATYNPFGTATTDDATPTNTYECFSIAHSGGDMLSTSTTNPEGKYYDKIYLSSLVDVSTNTSTPSYNEIVSTFLKRYLTGNDLLVKQNQTVVTDLKAISIMENVDNEFYPLNNKSGLVQINEVVDAKYGASVVVGSDNRLLLQVVNDTNSTDTVDLLDATNTIIYLPYYKG